jgi:hypothetical protein
MALTATRRKTARRKSIREKSIREKSNHGKTTRRKSARYWSGRVTRESNALDLEVGVFSQTDPKRVAASLKRSAERSRRRKSEPYRSALSMLVFYINRAGKKLPARRRRTLEQAKSNCADSSDETERRKLALDGRPIFRAGPMILTLFDRANFTAH